jgi:hypothetical protein
LYSTLKTELVENYKTFVGLVSILFKNQKNYPLIRYAKIAKIALFFPPLYTA